MAAVDGTWHERWVISDCWMPPVGEEAVPGHEAVCVTNVASTDVDVQFTALFEGASERTGRSVVVPARTSVHFLLEDAERIGGLSLPRETPYGLELLASGSVVVQYTRVDTRCGGLTLMTTLAWREEVGDVRH